MPAAGSVLVAVAMLVIVSVVITACLSVCMIVPVVVSMPMVMVTAAAGMAMRVGRLARYGHRGHFGRGQFLHVEAQGSDFLGDIPRSRTAVRFTPQDERLARKIEFVWTPNV